ncbi:MAG: hypothetical protein GC137_08150 [Alphaproteobacteria bacterium]|nr:hypothetical protein [Alphaproteobacteria bacterium]
MAGQNLILIIRPEKQGQLFIDRFDEVQKRQMVCASVFSIKNLHFLMPEAETFDSIIITSANVIPAIAKEAFYTKPIFCVGKGTTQQLKNKGFSKIEVVANTVAELLPEIEAAAYETFFYPRGVHITQNLSEMLSKVNKQLIEKTVYEAVEEKSFSKETINLLKNKNVQAVTFFSRRSAEIFVKLINKHNLSQVIKGIKALCISDGVIEYVHTNMNVNTYVSRTPDSEGMEELVLSYLK